MTPDAWRSRRDGPGGSFVSERPAHWTYESGGQGLWSTVDDYLAFARLFVGGGAVDGVRLLKPETLAMMTRDHLTAEQRRTATMFGMPLFGTGHGFGLGVAVVIDPATAAAALCRGQAGTVGWPGGFGGWWQADPTDGSVYVLLTHCMVELSQLAAGYRPRCIRGSSSIPCCGGDLTTSVTRCARGQQQSGSYFSPRTRNKSDCHVAYG